MTDANDMDLVREYATRNSEPAFATLVRRHVGLVYSVALRQAGNPSAAEEITQAVFLILARKAVRLRPDTILAGWLHETTRYVCASHVRGESRRRRREQEACMQSQLQESATDHAWEQLAPMLDEAIGHLGKADRNAVVLRFFQNKSAREIGAALNVHEAAAQKRLNRAVQKLRVYFLKRGVTVSTGVLTGMLSVGCLPSTPAHLSASVLASARTAVVSNSTSNLITGALKIMAWTKAKSIIVGGVIVLLAAGATTITVKEIQEHRTYPWQVHEGMINNAQINQPPQVRILPSKFHEPDWATINGKMIGTGVRAQNVVASAYGCVTAARVIFTAALPASRYDYIACLPGGADANETALQAEVKRKFGVIGRTITRPADVWLLQVKSPSPAGLRPNHKVQGNGLFATPHGFHGWQETMANLAFAVEDKANVPVVDQTGLADRFDFDLDCTENDFKHHDWEAVNRALGKIGLELVPTNRPVTMLVVETAK